MADDDDFDDLDDEDFDEDEEYDEDEDEDEDDPEERGRRQARREREEREKAREEELRLVRERQEAARRQAILEEMAQARQEIEVDLTAVLGTAEVVISNLLKVGRGAVIELNQTTRDLIEIQASEKPIAQGELVVVEDRLAISLVKFYKK